MFDEASAGDAYFTPITTVSDNFGQFTSDMVSLGENSNLPIEFSLFPNYPNPFNPSTIISYGISEDSFVSIDIFDMRGRVVKNLVSQKQVSGRYSVSWDGKDAGGNSVSAGVYIYKLSAHSKVLSRKMVLMK